MEVAYQLLIYISLIPNLNEIRPEVSEFKLTGRHDSQLCVNYVLFPQSTHKLLNQGSIKSIKNSFTNQ
jgi:hypothetical protein